MSRIRSKDTAPEMLVRRLLHGLGYRYVLHDARLPGKPDLVFPSRRKVVFVHGCFWHGHSCGRGFRPATNSAFWAAKIDRNVERHRSQVLTLKKLGWRPLTVWECDARLNRLAALQRRLVRFLDS
jgi:DNA mismatch endonuclease (patch repair protein)